MMKKPLYAFLLSIAAVLLSFLLPVLTPHAYAATARTVMVIPFAYNVHDSYQSIHHPLAGGYTEWQFQSTSCRKNHSMRLRIERDNGTQGNITIFDGQVAECGTTVNMHIDSGEYYFILIKSSDNYTVKGNATVINPSAW